MSTNDDRHDPAAAAKPPARPSLLDTPAATTPRPTDTQSLRMLDALEGRAPSAEDSGPARRQTAWWLALGLVVAGVLVWATTRSNDSADAAPERVATAPAAPEVKPVSEVQAASAPDDAASAATIVPVTEPAAATPAPQVAQVSPAAAEPAPAAAAPVAPKAAPRPARADTKTASRPASKPRPTTVASNDPDPLGSFIARQPKVAATTSLGAPSAAVGRESAARDADVELIAALLARVSRDGRAPAGALASQDQTTIADLIRRCDARGGDEALACKRRICDGYWGKAEACPMRLAPKKG